MPKETLLAGLFLASLPCAAAVAFTDNAPPAIRGAALGSARVPFGLPISPEKPDTIETYDAVTTMAGACSVRLEGASFTPNDAGKLIRIPGAGTNEGYFNGRIASVADATHIVLAAPCPTRAMERVSQRVTYGSDQTRNLQAAATLGAATNVGVFVQAGTYLTTAPIVCLPAAFKNGQNAPGAVCNMDMGATVMAMAPMTSVIQTGSLDFSAPIRNGTWGGGTVDCNFMAKYGDDAPLVIVGTLRDRVAKNCLLAGVREGREPTDPQPAAATGGGMLLSNWDYDRDSLYVTVIGITNADPGIVTTKFDHGLQTGRVITLVGMAAAGMAGMDLKFYEVEVVDARHFRLRNTDTRSKGTFHGSANMAMNMPSMHVPHVLRAASNANPVVVKVADAHNFANGQQIWLGETRGLALGGIYTACGVTPTTFQLHVPEDMACTGKTIDGAGLGTYAGGGSVEIYDDPLTVEKGVYLANMPDADGMNLQIKGVRWGVFANRATSGYDGKWIRLHIYNFGEDGQLFAGTSLGGDEVVESGQVDVPFRYGFQFTGLRNTVIGSRLDYLGLQQYEDYASAFRLEPGAQVDVVGGGAKGDRNASMLGTVSCNGCTTGNTPGFTSLGFRTSYVSNVQPNIVDGYAPIARLNGAGSPPRVAGKGPKPSISRAATDSNGTVTAGQAGQVVIVTFANVGYANPRDCNVTWLGGTAGIVGEPTNTSFTLTFGGSARKATYQCMGL